MRLDGLAMDVWMRSMVERMPSLESSRLLGWSDLVGDEMQRLAARCT